MTETGDLQNCTQPSEASDPIKVSQAKVSLILFKICLNINKFMKDTFGLQFAFNWAWCLLLLQSFSRKSALNFNGQVVCFHKENSVNEGCEEYAHQVLLCIHLCNITFAAT